MANYYFRDANSKKQGPYNERQIISFVARKFIAPSVLLETDGGHQITAATVVHSFSTDIGFAHFLTPTLITIIWWLTVITTIIGCLCTIGMTFSSDMPDGGKCIVAIATIAISVISLLYTRIILELIAIFFRMERHQRTIKEILEKNEKAAKP